MFLSFLAAILHGVGYTIYLFQIYNGNSVPNPSSWSVWMFLTILNALTFWRASKDALATTQFFTGSIMCLFVWTYSFFWSRFSPLDTIGWAVLLLCVFTCFMWRAKGAVYANLVVAGILFISSLPTINGVWQNTNVEQALSWYFWTTAFIATTINVVIRRDKSDPRWWLLLVLPIVGILVHGTVAVLATQ